jgi:tetratricopeptide (TPR) repeat protein
MRRQADDVLILIDFGIVKDTNAKSSSMSVRYGTQGYTPLEQWLGNAQFNSDIYALGMTVIQAVTCTYPALLSVEQRLLRLRRALSPALFEILSNMTEEDHVKRCQSAQTALLLLNPLRIRSLRGYRSPSRFVTKSTSKVTNLATPRAKQPKRKNIFKQFTIRAQAIFISVVRNTQEIFLLILRIIQDILKAALESLRNTFFSTKHQKIIKLLVAASSVIVLFNNPFTLKSDLDSTQSFQPTKNTEAETLSDNYFWSGTKKNEVDGALADYNKAIEINPQNYHAYTSRGDLKTDKLNNTNGALADYNKAIEIAPENPYAYNNRGFLKTKLNDTKGALADYNKAIEIDPRNLRAYNNRGSLRMHELNDYQGALTDYNTAIEINPEYVDAYYNRGNLKKDKLYDTKGALADYNIAIEINPQYADAYRQRGIIKKYRLENKVGAIEDFRQAIKLYREQGRKENLQDVIDELKLLGVSE